MRILGNIALRLNDDSKSWTLLTSVEYIRRSHEQVEPFGI
jgi:hypothetical protein